MIVLGGLNFEEQKRLLHFDLEMSLGEQKRKLMAYHFRMGTNDSQFGGYKVS